MKYYKIVYIKFEKYILFKSKIFDFLYDLLVYFLDSKITIMLHGNSLSHLNGTVHSWCLWYVNIFCLSLFIIFSLRRCSPCVARVVLQVSTTKLR